MTCIAGAQHKVEITSLGLRAAIQLAERFGWSSAGAIEIQARENESPSSCVGEMVGVVSQPRVLDHTEPMASWSRPPMPRQWRGHFRR